MSIAGYGCLKHGEEACSECMKPLVDDRWVEHLYGVLQEECAELIQAISKRRRFGPWSQNPVTLATAQQQINDEINDILGVVEMLARENERVHEDTSAQELKMRKVRKYYDAPNN